MHACKYPQRVAEKLTYQNELKYFLYSGQIDPKPQNCNIICTLHNSQHLAGKILKISN